ncbi:MAG: CCXG family PEP-CTERM protein [Thiotrichales bacterium]|nr:CCXG family PEP-CTERM protein [Thiotrichales bacterium]
MRMMKTAMATAILLASATSANAATINLETASYTDGSSPSDFVAAWNAATVSTTTSLTEFVNVQPGRDKINKLSIDFDAGQAFNLDFRFGLDAGYGAAIYLDDSLINQRSDDLWWSNNYNNSDVIYSGNLPVTAGSFSLDVYWAEGCCNGSNAGQFTVDGTNWQSLSVSNLNALSAQAVSAVPEPSTYALMLGGLGLVGFMAARRKKTA